MLKDSSVALKTLILLQFTRKLVIGTSPTVFLKERERKRTTEKEKFIEKVKRKIPEAEISEPIEFEPAKAPAPRRVIHRRPQQRLRVPETRLPSQFSYLKPYAKNEIELDLGKLSPLLADPSISVIESNGPDQQLTVRGRMGSMPVDIILTKEEIDKTLQLFSQKAKIPIVEGVTKIVLGKYMLSAIISEEAGSRFIIKKIPSAPQNPMMPRR